MAEKREPDGGRAGPATTLDPGVSSYLDLVRISAALTVTLSHLVPTLFGTYAIPGNDAVVLFFVISGYVIAYTHERRDDVLDRFVINRLARLWSVLFPALLISAVAAVLVADRTEVAFATPITAPLHFLWASLRTALFLGESWAWPTTAPYNDPTWSLNYEAWYYAIFAAYVFSPASWRWPAVEVAAVLAGPPVVALMPCWLVGVTLYRLRHRLVLPRALAYALFVTCVLAYVATYCMDLNFWSRQWLSALTFGHSYRLRTSTAMIGDIMLACLGGGTIVAVQNMPAINRVLSRAATLTRAAASRTLSLYLYHMPIFAILYGYVEFGRQGAGERAVGGVACIAAVIVLCLLLGGVTETRVARWRQALWRVYLAWRPAFS